MPLVNEEAKKFDKNTFPSNMRGRKLAVSYELKTRCGVVPGDMVKLESDMICNTIYGDQMGVDNKITISKDDIALLLAVAYDPHIKRTVLVLVPGDHLAYFVYDEIPPGYNFSELFTLFQNGDKKGY
jgi:hypothetical protein